MKEKSKSKFGIVRHRCNVCGGIVTNAEADEHKVKATIPEFPEKFVWLSHWECKDGIHKEPDGKCLVPPEWLVVQRGMLEMRRVGK